MKAWPFYDNKWWVHKTDALIKALHSPDIYDLENHIPDIADNFSFLLQVMIGPKDADGEESYDIEVCTPLWLLDHYTPTDIICGRHLLIVQHYDFKAIKN